MAGPPGRGTIRVVPARLDSARGTELAIRAALGATARGLVASVLREGVGMALIRVVVMLAAPTLVVPASFVAAYGPSRAAGRVDSVSALRSR